ncbi:addiction module HigA family antidote [Silvimonas terrae]|uniref:Addiction module HigA family antidote n=1 Tax=Silvimonas terrae TaxID=300266 RepID=A0A840RAN6_9NEIS|nr:HigA family addiction module antitoxin [Silvimonas terrae]MBB5190469.1 addiction module HigA family antidote [Silvimonas terrae]
MPIRMHNPPHPGETLREDILPTLGLTVTQAANELGITRAALSRILHGSAGISTEMALRLESWLNGPDAGPSAESWLRAQMSYDLWQTTERGRPVVTRVHSLNT